jgi:hypothetical protein
LKYFQFAALSLFPTVIVPAHSQFAPRDQHWPINQLPAEAKSHLILLNSRPAGPSSLALSRPQAACDRSAEIALGMLYRYDIR